MTNIIKCRFLDKDGEPRGREYSYKTEIPVEVGQIVDVPAPRQSAHNGTKERNFQKLRKGNVISS